MNAGTPNGKLVYPPKKEKKKEEEEVCTTKVH